jgi:hypothetical protein
MADRRRSEGRRHGVDRRSLVLCICVAALVTAGCWRVAGVAPPDAPRSSSHAAGSPGVFAPPFAVVDSIQAGGALVQLLVPRPSLTPRRPKIVQQLLDAPTAGAALEGANSVPVSDEDRDRALKGVVQPLVLPAGINSTSEGLLLQEVADIIIDTVDDAAPFFVDYGLTAAFALAAAHPASTVVGVVLSPSDVNRVHAPMPPNLYVLHGTDPTKFGPWYQACHFASASLVVQRAVLSSAEEQLPAGAAVEHVVRALPTSRVVYAALLPSELQDLDELVDPRTGKADPNTRPEWKTRVDELQLQIRRLGILWRSTSAAAAAAARNGQDAAAALLDDSGAVILVEIRVLASVRSCSKTWGAPLVQWDRRTLAAITDGGRRVSFAVRSVKKDAEGAKLGRTIHPLQYIPSVNLDTLLGAGLGEGDRTRLLGQMIATPRYSDPLPHNWIVGLGGRALRIDKVDKRYDGAVDEAKGYWGVSTRGYLHLLGHHLCLAISPEGVPRPLEFAGAAQNASQCRKSCRTCWKCCSYLPKASSPCPACRHCGSCAESSIGDAPNDRGATTPHALCQHTYASMHAARKVWGKWRASDAAHPPPSDDVQC